MEDLNYETLAVADMISNRPDIMDQIKILYKEGNSVEQIAFKIALDFNDNRPNMDYYNLVFANLLEHAMEQVDFEAIISAIIDQGNL